MARNTLTIHAYEDGAEGRLVVFHARHMPGYCENGVVIGKTFRGQTSFIPLRAINTADDVVAEMQARFPRDEIGLELSPEVSP